MTYVWDFNLSVQSRHSASFYKVKNEKKNKNELTTFNVLWVELMIMDPI